MRSGTATAENTLPKKSPCTRSPPRTTSSNSAVPLPLSAPTCTCQAILVKAGPVVAGISMASKLSPGCISTGLIQNENPKRSVSTAGPDAWRRVETPGFGLKFR